MMKFEFATANRIVFGTGAVREAGQITRSLGIRAFVITGRNAARAEPLKKALGAHGVEHQLEPLEGEPTTTFVRTALERARSWQCDCVIGFGGGSAVDAAKALAILLTNEGDPLDYIEVIGRGKSLGKPGLPCVAIPTTAGTGSEVTRNAVLLSPEHGVKASLRSPSMLPRVAVVDPGLCKDLPPAITASTGLDALTQLIEPYVCARPNPLTDVLCVEGMRRVTWSLRRAVEHGADLDAREDMSLASLFGGLALANAGLGAVHGFAAPIGGMFPAPHGAVCAALLPATMAVNVRALHSRQAGSPALRRYAKIARILTRQPSATPEQGVEWVRGLCRELKVPGLREYGIASSHFPQLVEKAEQASSMKANPVVLTKEELEEILRGSWE